MISFLKSYFIAGHLENAESLHDRSRIVLLFNITFSLFVLGLIASVVSLIAGTYPILVPAGGNMVLALVVLLLLKFKSVQLSASIYFFALYLLLFGNLNFNPGTMHVGSPFWIFLLNILVAYILGKRWGLVYIVASMIGFIYYIVFVLPVSLKIVNGLPKAIYYSAIYETVFALLLLGYIIWTILNASYDSERMMSKQNRELKEQNEVISLNNEEKTVLIKEVHHRVKNNLQVIISLMRLQMRELESKEAMSKFKETINRVLTMSMIHEKMYQSESLSKVNLEQYFADLSQDLLSSYQIEYDVEFKSEFNIDQIELKSIVPLALIFNELYSNSLKHAFSDTDDPKIELNLKKESDNVLLLEYTDNG